MGIPVLIGVCQQSTGGGGSPTFSMSGFTTTTTHFGNDGGTLNSIPLSERLTAPLTSGNSYTYLSETTALFYDEPEFPRSLLSDLVAEIDASGIPDASLPADGACAVRYRITPTTSEFLAWDVSTGAPYADPEDPFQVSITGLNRIDINGGGASQTLPPLSVDGSGIGIRFLSQDAEGRGYDVTMGILMSDGSYLEASNAPLQVVVGAVTPPAIKVVLL